MYHFVMDINECIMVSYHSFHRGRSAIIRMHCHEKVMKMDEKAENTP